MRTLSLECLESRELKTVSGGMDLTAATGSSTAAFVESDRIDGESDDATSASRVTYLKYELTNVMITS